MGRSVRIAPSSDDQKPLRVLALLYYAKAIVIAFHALCLIPCFLLLGHIVLTGDTATAFARNVMRFGQAATALCFCLLLLAVSLAFFNWLAARRLSALRGYRLCISVAATSCLFFPLGTVLGAITLSILLKPSVKSKFTAHDDR